MSDITIASTTDSMEDIRAAVEGTPPPTAPVVTEQEAPPDAQVPDTAAPVDAPVDAPADAPVDEPADTASEADAVKPEKPAAVRERKRDLQTRIDELTRDKYSSQRAANEARSYAERLQSELDAMRSGARREETVAPTAPTTTDAEPKSEDFPTFEEFTRATAKWAAKAERQALEQDTRKLDEERRRAYQQSQDREYQTSVETSHFQRLDAARLDIPDFDAVVDAAIDLPVPPPMKSVIMNEEQGPRLMYYLCQHPEECERIARLAPTPQLVALGRLITKIENEVATTAAPVEDTPKPVAKKAAPVSKLPPPPKTVGGGTAASTVPLDELSYAEYRDLRNQQELAKRR